MSWVPALRQLKRPNPIDRLPLRLLLEPSRGMRQHGVHLAGVRSQVVARHRSAAFAARHVVEQPLELVDILLDGLPELGVGAYLRRISSNAFCPWAV